MKNKIFPKELNLNEKNIMVVNNELNINKTLKLTSKKDTKKSFVFKTYNTSQAQYNDLFCSALANKLDLPCEDYTPASLELNGQVLQGNICLNPTKDIVNFKEARSIFYDSYNSIADIIRKIKKESYCCKLEDVQLDLFKIAVFDYLTCQTERFDSNYGFIFDNGKKEISVAPLFNNENSFGIFNGEIYTDPTKIVNFPFRFAPYNSNTVSNDFAYCNNSENGYELVKFALKNKKTLEFLDKAITCVNVDNIINDLKKQNINLPQDVVDMYKKCIDKKRNTLVKYLNLLEKQPTKQDNQFNL